jgi:hypothetical protein
MVRYDATLMGAPGSPPAMSGCAAGDGVADADGAGLAASGEGDHDATAAMGARRAGGRPVAERGCGARALTPGAAGAGKGGTSGAANGSQHSRRGGRSGLRRQRKPGGGRRSAPAKCVRQRLRRLRTLHALPRNARRTAQRQRAYLRI